MVVITPISIVHRGMFFYMDQTVDDVLDGGTKLNANKGGSQVKKHSEVCVIYLFIYNFMFRRRLLKPRLLLKTKTTILWFS